MRAPGTGSSWTHLIPGRILGGVGVGLVNPPLAAAAVGVVGPKRAGMAAGINSTFRQVGMATGIAVLGTLFSHKVMAEVRDTITTVPGISGRAAQLAGAVQSGHIGSLTARLPTRTGQNFAMIARSAVTDGLNEILVVGAYHRVRIRADLICSHPQPDLVARGPRPAGRMTSGI